MTKSKLSRLLLGLLLSTLALPASAEVYTITLQNGNSFLSKYKPVDAAYDPSFTLFMSDVGNLVAIAKADIADITSETESRGFGVVIDTTTILIGESLNDLPTEEQAREALQQQGARPSFPRPQANTLQFGEPSVTGGSSTGGLPVGFASGFVQVPPG